MVDGLDTHRFGGVTGCGDDECWTDFGDGRPLDTQQFDEPAAEIARLSKEREG